MNKKIWIRKTKKNKKQKNKKTKKKKKKKKTKKKTKKQKTFISENSNQKLINFHFKMASDENVAQTPLIFQVQINSLIFT